MSLACIVYLLSLSLCVTQTHRHTQTHTHIYTLLNFQSIIDKLLCPVGVLILQFYYLLVTTAPAIFLRFYIVNSSDPLISYGDILTYQLQSYRIYYSWKSYVLISISFSIKMLLCFLNTFFLIFITYIFIQNTGGVDLISVLKGKNNPQGILLLIRVTLTRHFLLMRF